MKQVPKTENALVLRTDFSNQATWEEIRTEIQKPVSTFQFLANVEFLDDLEFKDMTKDQLLELIPRDYNHTFIIIADPMTISHSDHPLLIVDLHKSPGREFRAVPAQVQSIENNLSLANLDFEDFADSVDEDGVFRGFPQN